jgi:hypothetical protein
MSQEQQNLEDFKQETKRNNSKCKTEIKMGNRLGKMSQRRNENHGRKVTRWSFGKTQRIARQGT